MSAIFKILLAAVFFFCVLCANAQVTADFSANVPSSCAPVAVQFADSTKGNPTFWVWDFGNGDTSHARNPQAVYDSAGTYTITLTAGNSSSSNTVAKTITIIGSVAAGFTYQYDNVCAAPSSFSFRANDKGDTITYAWNFDNGTTGSGKATTTVFNTNRTYNVRLITTTPQGCKDTAYQSFAIGSVKTGFISFATVCKNAFVTFTDTSKPIPLSRSWIIDGVNRGSGSSLVIPFSTNGSHDVKLMATFGTCTGVEQKTITVKDRPVAGFSTSGTLQSCNVPATVQFSNSSTNADTYKWVYGDGNSATTQNPSYTYTTTGSFSPMLVAFNGDGCSDTLIQANLIRLGPPVINGMSGLPKSGCIPVAASADPLITSPDPVTTYEWNTGDNNILVNGSHFTHTYTAEGYYNVTLNVTTQNGCTGTYLFKQAVAAGTKPVTDFTVDQPTVCASVPVNFIDQSVGTVTSWNWNFGDGLSATGKNPSHLFTKIGSNDVTLYISNKGCAGDPKTIKNVVTVLPPIAGFTYSYTCASQLAVQFTDKSQQPISWQWKFGDGQTSSQQNPFYTYASPGEYDVILTATNGTCTSSDTMAVSLTSEKPSIQIQPSQPFFCRNDTVTLSAVSHSGFIRSYVWNAGDGSPTVNDSTLTHVYTKSKDYKPYVAVQYTNGCRDTVYTTDPLHVYGPTAAFTALPARANCIPLDVTFTDNSTGDGLHAIDFRKWIYGDGGFSDGVNNVSHVYTYTSGGSFYPKLMITDAVGCTDSVMASSPIVAQGVTAEFSYTIQPGCDSAVVTFTNSSRASNDNITSYSWGFGDNTRSTSSSATLTHTYYTAGSYSVSLDAFGQSGCGNKSQQVIDISLSPKQDIVITAPNAACVASDISLSASVSGNNAVSQWKWNLGNGITKNGQTVTANYGSANSYTISAIAFTANGCSDTAYQGITISDAPPTAAGRDSFVCAGSSIILGASGASSYTWLSPNNDLSCTNCVSPVASPSASTSYVVIGKNEAGCTSQDTVLIQVQNKEIVNVEKDAFAVCEEAAVQLSASGSDEYTWQPATGLNNASIANPLATPTENIVYTVTGTDRHHCFTDSKDITISIEQKPQFDIVDSLITLSRGTKYTLATTSSSDITQWLWQPATGLSCTDCPQPELTATMAGLYTAVAITANGCRDTDAVKVVLLCDGKGIFIPTAFTPNGDGRNDRFYPKSFADSKIISFIIVSRNGEVVYRLENVLTNASADGWDGIYKGQPLPTGTYIYKIEVQCENDVIPFSGTVTLMR